MTARAALVTGASRGIGAQICERLAGEGWDLVVTARNQEQLEQFAGELAERSGRTIVPMPADMAELSAAQTVADAFEGVHDRLDALVLNAGMGAIGSFSDFPLRRLEKLFAVNVRATYALIQHLLPLLRKTGAMSPHGARVIALSSMTGLAAEPLNSAYGATKAALTSMCETLTVEEYEHGVNATAVCPGYVATDMTSGLPGVDAASMITPGDVAEMVVSLTRLTKNVTIPHLPMTRPGPHLWRA
ncbi:hypothetical protein Rruber_05330 (plasmid) [Rhodococcus ruber]|uniref:SDR family NAD(P)-dependent oxidoreductase n=1 Tax=Rhodococcus ruber TaxID=1830 RepID=UPI00315C825F